MDELNRNRSTAYVLARKGRLAVSAALLGTLLAACGGDGDSPAAAAPAASSAAPASSGGRAAADTPSPGAAPSSGGGSPASGASDTLAGVASAKGATTLSWTPPTSNDDGTTLKLTGYRIYWGLAEGHYPHSVTLDNPGLTRYVVEQLAPATWYFVATALSDQAESTFSNVVKMEVQ